MKIRDIRTFFQFSWDNWISNLIHYLFNEMDLSFRVATNASVKKFI